MYFFRLKKVAFTLRKWATSHPPEVVRPSKEGRTPRPKRVNTPLRKRNLMPKGYHTPKSRSSQAGEIRPKGRRTLHPKEPTAKACDTLPPKDTAPAGEKHTKREQKQPSKVTPPRGTHP